MTIFRTLVNLTKQAGKDNVAEIRDNIDLIVAFVEHVESGCDPEAVAEQKKEFENTPLTDGPFFFDEIPIKYDPLCPPGKIYAMSKDRVPIATGDMP